MNFRIILKTTLLLLAFILIPVVANAQTWKGLFNHNGYQCCSLISSDKNTVLATKGASSWGYDFLHVKFRIPYNWGITGTANVRATLINLKTGKKYMQQTFYSHRDGWVYLGHNLVCGSKPCYSYVITVYRDNDFGRSGRESKTYNLYLNTLPISRMPVNDKPLEIYW